MSGDSYLHSEQRKWGPSLGVCMKCDRLRKVQFVGSVEKWLCARCEKTLSRGTVTTPDGWGPDRECPDTCG